MEQNIPITVLIAEDEAVIAMNMQSSLTAYGYKVLTPALTCGEAEALLRQETPDIALVDINFNEKKTGFDLARLINTTYGIPFIFVTANTDGPTISAASAFKPAAYLTKPFTKETLYASIQVAIYNSRNKNSVAAVVNKDSIDYFIVKIGNNFTSIHYAGIAFIQFEGRYSMAHTVNGKKYPLRISLGVLEYKLGSMGFIRISKNTLVNLKHVTDFNAEHIHLLGQALAISRAYKSGFFSRVKQAQ